MTYSSTERHEFALQELAGCAADAGPARSKTPPAIR